MGEIETDYTAKYIIFEMNGILYSLDFQDSFLKGIHDITVWQSNPDEKISREVPAKIKDAYPPIGKRISVWASDVRERLKKAVNC